MAQTNIPRQFYTPAQVAERLEVTRNTVRKWIRQGDLRCYKLGPRIYRIRKSDLDRFIRKMRLT